MTIVHVELKGKPLEGALIVATPSKNGCLKPQKARTDGGGNGGLKSIPSTFQIEVKHGLLPGGSVKLERDIHSIKKSESSFKRCA